MTAPEGLTLVTGGTGFLGGAVVRELLAHGHRVAVAARSATLPLPEGVERRLIDLTDFRTFGGLFAGVRRVVHVAGMVDFGPKDGGGRLNEVNFHGTANLLTAAKEAGVEKAVHVSSISTLGAARAFDRPRTEADFGTGLGIDLPYPRSKIFAERAALKLADEGLPVTIVNPTFFAGPGDVNLTSARTIVSFLRGQTWVGLTAGGFGYTDVRDVATGIRLALEKGKPGERHILGGHNIRLRDYHALLSRLSGVRAPWVRLPPAVALPLAKVAPSLYHVLGKRTYVGAGDVRMGRHWWVCDYRKAETGLGLRCRPIAESLADTLAWLAQAGHWSGKKARPPAAAGG